MRSIRLLEYSVYDFTNLGNGLPLTIPLGQKIQVGASGSCNVAFRLHQTVMPAGATVQLVVVPAAPTPEDPVAVFQGNPIAVAQFDSTSAAPSIAAAATNLYGEYVAAFLVVTQTQSGQFFGVALSADLYPNRTVVPFGLNLAWGGKFARGLAAFYYTQAPTDGTSAFLRSAPADVRRSGDNRGDGIPPSLLMEKSAMNLILDCRNPKSSAWTTGIGTVNTNLGGGPDGTMSVTEIQILTTKYSPYQAISTSSKEVTGSIWHKCTGGGPSQSSLPNDSANIGSGASITRALTGTWQRDSASTNVGVGGTVQLLDGRAGNAFVNTALDNQIDLPQVEFGYYPTSPIVTASAIVTRPADTLSYPVGTYPSGFLTDGVVIDFAPDASSTDIASSALEEWRLIQVGTNDYLRIINGSGSCKAELFCGGVLVVTATIAFSRGQRLTFTVKPMASTLIINGVPNVGTGGAAWGGGTNKTLYVGGDNTGAKNVTGRYVNAMIMQAT